MSDVQLVNSKGTVKRSSTADMPFSPAQPVIAEYLATSTAAQTVINLPFTIVASGANANTAICFLYVDGKKLTFGSGNDYTFTAIAADGTSSQITLNQSLISGLNIQVYKMGLKKEIEFLTDNRFTQLFEYLGDGFQGFVNKNENIINPTSVSGTPAAGTFYSTIIGRAPMMDLSQDLELRGGNKRVMVQSIVQLQNEFGPNGEPVWAALNDQLGQIRFVGANWGNYLNVNGPSISMPYVGSEYVEITFYGTGVNLLNFTDSNARTFQVSVDGGSPTAGSYPASGSAILNNRNYATNQLLNLSSLLSLGVHTIKLIPTSVAPILYGFEILNETSTLKIGPGVAYNKGQKLILSSQQSPAYNAVVTGTRGGRVLSYINADGSFGQSFQAVNAASATLTSTDHTNEEVIREINVLEFSAGRTDDFSSRNTSLWSSGGNAAFTLDDGTTTLVASPTSRIIGNNQLNAQNIGDFWTLTFIGTGIDVILAQSGASNTSSFILDGVSLGSGSANIAQYTAFQKKAVVSGLPYGTHTLKCLTASSANNLSVVKFITYQPKKPTLPTGAVEIADYNVMANYVANTSPYAAYPVGNITFSSGVLRKVNTRELVYTGTGWTFVSVDPLKGSGSNLYATVNGDSVSYTFMGTGVELRFTSISGGGTCTVSLNGSTNLSSFTTNLYAAAGVAWTPATGELAETSATTAYGNLLSISGLTFGTYTIKLTKTGGSNMYLDTLDIITPIYSPKSNLYSDLQNTLMIGSNSIGDTRKFTPVKEALPEQKAWAQAVGVTSSPTTNSTAFIPCPDMSCSIKTTGGVLDISFSGNFQNSVGPVNTVFAQIYIDGVAVMTDVGVSATQTGSAYPLSIRGEVAVSPGYHKVDVYWKVDGSTYTAITTKRILTVKET